MTTSHLTNTAILARDVPQRNSPEARMFAGLQVGSIEWQRRELEAELATKERSAVLHRRPADAGGTTHASGQCISAEISQACADGARYMAYILRGALAALPTAETAQQTAAQGAAAAVTAIYEARPWEAGDTP